MPRLLLVLGVRPREVVGTEGGLRKRAMIGSFGNRSDIRFGECFDEGTIVVIDEARSEALDLRGNSRTRVGWTARVCVSSDTVDAEDSESVVGETESFKSTAETVCRKS